MKDFYTLKFNFKGGIVSPGDLRKILLAAKTVNISTVKLSLRQQLILHVPHHTAKVFMSNLTEVETPFYTEEDSLPNLVSSYVSEAVFQKSAWLTEGIYKDILDSFQSKPRLKINISDNSQSFSPFFSGHLNFISSETPNFWHFYLRLPQTNEVIPFELLIYSQDISKICQTIETEILDHKNLWSRDLFNTLKDIISIPKSEELKLPRFSLPYYEGFNRYDNKTWLGIYRRGETYSTDFLLEVCDLCKTTKIGEICLTPWKSLIVKNIGEKDRNSWSALLAKYNINVRHAANELNWQVEDDSEVALNLKMELTEYFNHIDQRTFGLCFGIKIAPKTEVFASIMIQKRRFKIFNLIPSFYVYDISYTADFDPNGRNKLYFSRGVSKLNLKEQLRRSIGFYYQNTISENDFEKAEPEAIFEKTPVSRSIYQCPDCLMVYDEKFGDELAGIPAGVVFKNLPETYECGVCGCEKNKFKTAEQSQLV